MLVFNLLLAALAAAKEVPSPIQSFSLSLQSNPGASQGSVSEIWLLNANFSTETLEAFIEAGDHFTFTVDDYLYFGGKEIAFDVLDQSDEALFKVVSDEHLHCYLHRRRDPLWFHRGRLLHRVLHQH